MSDRDLVASDIVAKELRADIGSTLRRRREASGLTQAELAGRVGTSQATVARIEQGVRGPSTAMLARLFEVLGYQLRLRLEPLNARVDEAIETLSGTPLAERIAEVGIPAFAAALDPIPHVFTGATAALLQGAPVPAGEMEILLSRDQCHAFATWLGRRYGARWHPGYQQFGFARLDPCLPGEMRWRIIGDVTIRVDLVDQLPAGIQVRHGDRTYQVVPLPELEIKDRETARLLRRYRERQGSTADDLRW